ncbi:MAG: hypothetical protein Q8R25_02875 [bacterium]|nr:hypothetical protein [bacterium]
MERNCTNCISEEKGLYVNIVKSSGVRVLDGSFNDVNAKLSPARPNEHRLLGRYADYGDEMSRGAQPARRLKYSPLSNNDKCFVRAHPELTIRQIADERHLAAPMVSALRREDAIRLLKAEFPALSDADLAGRVGLTCYELRRVRKSLGLYRLRGARAAAPHKSRKIFPSKLGTVAEICYALTEGGMTVVDIVRRRKVKISRQRAHTIIEEMGLVESKLVRTARWYATRIGHPELGEKISTKAIMKGAYSVSAVADRLRPRVSQEILSRILKLHGLDSRRVPFKSVSLVCAYCGKKFTIPGYEYRARMRLGKRKRKLCCKRKCSSRFRWKLHPRSFKGKKGT